MIEFLDFRYRIPIKEQEEPGMCLFRLVWRGVWGPSSGLYLFSPFTFSSEMGRMNE